MSCSLTKTHPSSPFKNFTAPRSCLLRSLAFAILNMSCSPPLFPVDHTSACKLRSSPLTLPSSLLSWPPYISPLKPLAPLGD
ncbi:hypothetical protein HanPI659440_Chr07g0257631 [Helianthus annuus]|nr:hypothetical protein HanPI659440_Chr07g0257631 [Helianthus annuus]